MEYQNEVFSKNEAHRLVKKLNAASEENKTGYRYEICKVYNGYTIQVFNSFGYYVLTI